MNQILSVELSKGGKQKNKLSVHSILKLFSIMLIIFGIGMAGIGAYSYIKNKSNKKENNGLEISSNTKPVITIERVGAATINIDVTHDKEIKTVAYSFNDEEKIEVPGNGQNKLKIENIKLPIGESSVEITAKDINGVTASYTSTAKVTQKPEIKLAQVEGKIQATVESKINIDTLSYYWDEDTTNTTTLTINDVKTVTLIDVLQGNHTLNIKAVDVEGNEEQKTQKIIGDNKPTVDITTDGKKFIIEATDDEELSRVEITLNSNQTITENINEKQYHKEIELEDGVNKLILKVYNKNEISETKKVKTTKE